MQSSVVRDTALLPLFLELEETVATLSREYGPSAWHSSIQGEGRHSDWLWKQIHQLWCSVHSWNHLSTGSAFHAAPRKPSCCFRQSNSWTTDKRSERRVQQKSIIWYYRTQVNTAARRFAEGLICYFLHRHFLFPSSILVYLWAPPSLDYKIILWWPEGYQQ